MTEHARALVEAARRRHPHELMLLVASALQGILFVAGLRAPSSIASSEVAWIVPAWYVMLLASGVIGLVGNTWAGALITGLRLRLSGMLLAAGPAAVYSVVVFTGFGATAAYAGGVTVAYAIACLWRALQLTSDIRRLTALAAS